MSQQLQKEVLSPQRSVPHWDGSYLLYVKYVPVRPSFFSDLWNLFGGLLEAAVTIIVMFAILALVLASCGGTPQLKSPESDPWNPVIPDDIPTLIIEIPGDSPVDSSSPPKPEPEPEPEEEEEEDEDCDATPDGCLIFDYEYA
jgi:hypothetical protein